MRGYTDDLIIISPQQLADEHFRAALEVVKGTGFGITTKAHGLVSPKPGVPSDILGLYYITIPSRVRPRIRIVVPKEKITRLKEALPKLILALKENTQSYDKEFQQCFGLLALLSFAKEHRSEGPVLALMFPFLDEPYKKLRANHHERMLIINALLLAFEVLAQNALLEISPQCFREVAHVLSDACLTRTKAGLGGVIYRRVNGKLTTSYWSHIFDHREHHFLKNANIMDLELLACQMTISRAPDNALVYTHIDNVGGLFSLRRASARRLISNAAIQQFYLDTARKCLRTTLLYISSKRNTADAPSRIGQLEQCAQHRGAVKLDKNQNDHDRFISASFKRIELRAALLTQLAQRYWSEEEVEDTVRLLSGELPGEEQFAYLDLEVNPFGPQPAKETQENYQKGNPKKRTRDVLPEEEEREPPKKKTR